MVNDLKKQKNVNFSQSQTNIVESPGPLSRSRSRSPSPNTSAALRGLVADNERLRRTAAQQSAQIAELASRAARMHAALRPRTAPAALPHGLNRPNATAFGWCKGAGEELSLLGQQPAVLTPGSPQPFLGLCGERRSDSRRHLIKPVACHASPYGATREQQQTENGTNPF
ncbi:uncharacterized protein [Choristoneura fumiferana]|uniref:uncharacterized protein n=1 Tax=Choristoneura fumiferana TaxID=7141 RepID=UPI003D1588E0